METGSWVMGLKDLSPVVVRQVLCGLTTVPISLELRKNYALHTKLEQTPTLIVSSIG